MMSKVDNQLSNIITIWVPRDGRWSEERKRLKWWWVDYEIRSHWFESADEKEKLAQNSGREIVHVAGMNK